MFPGWGTVGFWDEQCPVRQDGLKHAHNIACPDSHRVDQCCECGDLARNWKGAGVEAVAPPLDINARLRSIGFNPSPADDPVEPKMATGVYTGPENARGRGELTRFDKARLGWIVWMERRVGYR